MTVESPNTATYDRFYFQTYRDGPYERNAKWMAVFGALADGLVRELNPRTVLDVGCAKGLLVEALRDRGVEAFGLDVSADAIADVREDVRPYCRTGSILEPLPRRCDLVVCMEVVEHLPAEAVGTAIANLCAAADDVFFSSSPDDFQEPTHLNVQPPEYWAALFAQHGFARDVDFIATVPFPAWALRFRRSTAPAHRQVEAYERRLWALWRENAALKARAVEAHNQLARQDAALRSVPAAAEIAETVKDQQAQIEALNERLSYMSDSEQALRALLLDTHQQLLQRDQLLAAAQPVSATVQEQQRQIEQLVAHIHHVTRQWELRGEEIEGLRGELEAARSAIGLSGDWRETLRCLQAVIDERTAAAAQATAEARAHEHALRSVLMSSSWKLTAPLRALKLRRRLGR